MRAMSAFWYTFPAIRGIQATREFYVTMFPMKLIPRLLLFDEQELSLKPEYRVQRVLNKARIPAICNYLLNNPTDYVFSALTVSVDGDVIFSPLSDDPSLFSIGQLRIPMTARFVVNDGQHRRAAIEAALRKRPELGDEHIACVLFIDTGLERCQQMFADLNRHAVRPTRSISILYDHRDPFSKLVRKLVQDVPVFRGLTELDKSTIPNRSTKLFTLSGIFRATKELVASVPDPNCNQQYELARMFWGVLSQSMPQWADVRNGRVPASVLRRDYLNAHTVTLVAIGRAGRDLVKRHPKDWHERLRALAEIDWRRTNPEWEGRSIVGGKVSISRNNITLLTNAIKKHLGLNLNQDEQEAEDAFLAVRRGSGGGEATE